MKLDPKRLALLVATILAATAMVACSAEDDTPASQGDDLTGRGEHQDILCNDGAMVIRADPQQADRYLLEIHDQGVIDWFEAQSKETACGESYDGGTACVDKDLPWYVSIEQDPSDDQLRLMIIEDLRSYGGGRYLTSEPGTEAKARDGGYDVTINGMKMPNSHTNVRYTVGQWFFESCETFEPADAAER